VGSQAGRGMGGAKESHEAGDKLRRAGVAGEGTYSPPWWRRLQTRGVACPACSGVLLVRSTEQRGSSRQLAACLVLPAALLLHLSNLACGMACCNPACCGPCCSLPCRAVACLRLLLRLLLSIDLDLLQLYGNSSSIILVPY
jgi:hypothetical protein